MTTRDKLEKVLEYIINEETDKASDLLHDVFVEKARGIYENLVAEDEVTTLGSDHQHRQRGGSTWRRQFQRIRRG